MGRRPKQSTSEHSNDNPSPEMLLQGKRFGAWFRASLRASPYDNVSQLAIAMGISRQSLYPYQDDCIDGGGNFRGVSREKIEQLANALHANAQDGINAFYGSDSHAVPLAIADLPSDAQQALAQFVGTLYPKKDAVSNRPPSYVLDTNVIINTLSTQSELVEIVAYLQDPETREIIKHFNELPKDLRGPVLASIAGMVSYKNVARSRDVPLLDDHDNAIAEEPASQSDLVGSVAGDNGGSDSL